ncbi:exported protein of unknown function [Tenacibaculum sp. 190524A02b]|uniref:hypothetical protein n=1 Tax=Tenacibaculum vairaonense TaxID=3137860 RepID=UPI0032B23C92
MRKLLVHILLFVVCTNANCQNQPQALPTLIPQSPDVYSLSKFEETPVSHFSGVPNISIPIYNFKNRDISIPIGLNYHSGGIKVDEIASSIGLGWSMNVGGHITRVLKGLPDEESYLKTSDKVTDYINLINNGNHEETIRLISKVKKDKTLDYQPDEFVYNFMGYSGKFVFNQDRSDENPYGEIVMLPESDVKIDFEIEGTRIINWEITTPNGVKYFFGVNSYSSFESEGGAELLTSTQNISTNSGGHDTYNTLLCFTSWYLKEIRLLNNQTIRFNYNVDNFGRASFNSETRRLQPNDHFSTKSYSSSYGKTSRIKSIEGINGKVEFNYSDRQDSYEKKIRIY